MLKYTPAERDFYAEAWMSMYFGALEGTVTLHCKPNYFNGHFGMVVKIPNSIPVIGGINFGGANCDMTITDKYWQVAAGVWFQVVPDVPQICIPEVCVNWSIPCPRIKCSWGGCSYWTHWHRGRTCTPRLCTPAINNSWSKVKFNVRYHSQSGFSAAERGNLAKMYSANLKREPWENPFVSIIEVPEEKAYAVFNDNWDVLYESVTLAGNRNIRKQGPTVETIEVTEDLASAIFRLSFENEVEDLDLLLITPDGAELDVHDGPMPFGFTEGAKGMAVINGNAKEAYFLLNDVKAGPYDLVIGDKTPLGGTLVELVSPNAVPQALGVVASEAGARDGTVIPNQFDIDWAYFDADEGDNTVISFYVDKDRKGFDGHIVGGGLLSEIDPDESFTFLTDSLGLRPGWYYTYLEVNDGRNTPERIYSDDRIYIDMDNAPDSVETMATIAGANQFTVSWDTVADERAKYYNIVYSKSPTFDNIAGSQMAHLQWPGQSKFERVTVGGLENGVPYYVAVLSVDDNFGESAPKVIQRVVPTPYPGGTPPVITSDPKKKATAGYQWYYRPTFFDGDEHNPEIVENIGEQVRTEIDWELVMAPSGMSIDKASGLVTWKPTTNQEGQHRVVISAKEHKGEGDPLKEGEFTFDVHNQIAIQEFEINVFPPHLLNGVPYLEDTLTFVSEPVITAVGGKLYTYEPQVYANDQAYELFVLNGPEGIHIEDNIVKWDVPVDGKSDFIELRAETDAGNFIEQTYFVHVHSEQGVLPLETSIVMHEPLKGGMVIGWVGAANNYQIQRASSLTPDANGIINWTDVGDPHGNGPVNFYIEEKQIGESGYYRIKDLE